MSGFFRKKTNRENTKRPPAVNPSIELNAQGGFFGVWFSGVGFPNNMAWKL